MDGSDQLFIHDMRMGKLIVFDVGQPLVSLYASVDSNYAIAGSQSTDSNDTSSLHLFDLESIYQKGADNGPKVRLKLLLLLPLR